MLEICVRTRTITDMTTQQLSELFNENDLHHGFGKFDDLGVGVNYDLYEINRERADEKMQQPCNHCGRGLNPNTSFLAIYAYGNQSFISVDVDHDTLMQFTSDTYWVNARTGETGTRTSLGWSWVFLGSECAKNLPARFKMLQKDFDNSKWNGTAAHHDTEWGTW